MSRRTPGPTRAALTKAARRPLVLAAVTWMVLVVAASCLASVLAPYDPLAQDLSAAAQGPSGAHLLGTDELGRDLLSRLLHGGGTLLAAALLPITVACVLGVVFGLLAGYLSGLPDLLITFVTNILFSVPALVVILAVAIVSGNSLWALTLTLGVLLSGGLVRLVRAGTQATRDLLYVDAARIASLPRRRILARHILPSVLATLIVEAFLLYGGAFLFLTSLSFLGIGYSPESPSWGQMINDATRHLQDAPWMMVPSGLAVVCTLLALNFIGSTLVDALPRAQRGSLLAPRGTRRGRNRSGRDEALVRDSAGAVEAAPADVPEDSTVVLRTRGLTVSFPAQGAPEGDLVTVVDAVDLTVRRGEIVALVGESGCGKTMTALALLRLTPPPCRITAGSVVLDGRDLVGMDEQKLERLRGSRIGYISQEPMAALDPCLTVGALLSEPLRLHRGLSKADARVRAAELLRLVGIHEPAAVLRHRPHELSGGMAQRVCIALALAGEPDLLIADEPTTALDVTVQAEILDLLRSLRDRLGMAVVLVTHDLGVVADLCDRAVVMYAGQIVERGAVEQVLTSPAHPYTRALRAASPEHAVPGTPLVTVPGTVPSPGEWPAGCRFADRCPYATEACVPRTPPLLDQPDERQVRCVRVAQLPLPERAHQ
ncbi:dipeptide/oligopeptide/nickel ABC transporter permease/ATP-binding protein [Streptomyces sp. S3(2020)]|uniref:dipeptide/oligopeptide/nickel ABC transporter permease/ATP-binding protein n=1 Tax=Streptomyces sp. S3(2020) TaxID=2732044 RepID=UPI001487FF94|nr:dipeptide/oligopeptide/nickel ABC transporter permease/ATP-binding protein [Streptomyces sp. S3(2020)]NNN30757.1 dipeptide/oligopeptide/nickel ABC transporter permease/ATP-binding protein [Streptomyces sp. S3(2020)]